MDTGSISRAADRLAVAKSALSRRASNPEQRLGVQLLRRTTRNLNLTNSGKSFYERANEILEDLKEAELVVSQQHGSVTGRLKDALILGLSQQ